MQSIAATSWTLYYLPGLAIIFAWLFPRPTVSIISILLLLTVSWTLGLASLPGLAAIVLLLTCAVIYALHQRLPVGFEVLQRRQPPLAVVTIATVVFLALVIALAMHAVPGFANVNYLAETLAGSGVATGKLRFTLDKPLLAAVLAALCVAKCPSPRQCLNLARPVAWQLLTYLPIIAVIGLATGILAFDLKFSTHYFRWAYANLLYTCVAEEIFFRGILQRHATQALARYRHGSGYALAAVSLLFGAAHLGGGWKFVILATIAGFAYGQVYQRTRRIEAAILLHFAVNSAHFLLFTYPMAKNAYT